MRKKILFLFFVTLSLVFLGCTQNKIAEDETKNLTKVIEEKPKDEAPVACIQVYDPVCGENGKTYSNECFAGLENVKINYKGECQSQQESENKEIIETEESKGAEFKPFEKEGVVFSNPTLHNFEIITLENGKYRMFFHQANQIKSAISSDGKKFILEEGVRLEGQMPATVKLSDGSWRMYFSSNGAIKSAISDDGFSFKAEEGVRLSPGSKGSFDEDGLIHPSVIQLPDSSYKMFYDGALTDSQNPDLFQWTILSASSKDGIDWQKDPGKRIEEEDSEENFEDEADEELDEDIETDLEEDTLISMSWSPHIDYKNGIYILYFTVEADPFSKSGVWVATSDDGLNFDIEGEALLAVESKYSNNQIQVKGGPKGLPQDPFILKTKNGERLFYWLAEEGIYSAFREAENVNLAADDSIQADPFSVPLENPEGDKNNFLDFDPYGPFYHNLKKATSKNGIDFTKKEGNILERVSVPDALHLEDGTILIYMVDGGGRAKGGLIIGRTKDEGETFDLTTIKIQTKRQMPNFADPQIVLLPDGTFRLFYIVFSGLPVPGGPQPTSYMYTATSTDGVSFVEEEEYLLSVEMMTDPDVIQIDNEWFVYISQGPKLSLYTSGSDFNFKLKKVIREKGSVSKTIKDGNTYYQFFCRDNNLFRATSSNALDWKDETNVLTAPSEKIICDPAPVKNSQGEWILFYKEGPAMKVK